MMHWKYYISCPFFHINLFGVKLPIMTWMLSQFKNMEIISSILEPILTILSLFANWFLWNDHILRVVWRKVMLPVKSHETVDWWLNVTVWNCQWNIQQLHMCRLKTYIEIAFHVPNITSMIIISLWFRKGKIKTF